MRVLIGSVELFKINTKFKDWRYSGIIEYSSHSPYQVGHTHHLAATAAAATQGVDSEAPN